MTKGYILSVVTFVAGLFFSPWITQFSSQAIKASGIFEKQIYVSGCSPLRSASTIIRKKGQIISSSPSFYPNLASLIIRNDTGIRLTEVVIVIHPIGRRDEAPELLTALVDSTSVLNSTKTVVRRTNSTLEISLPNYNTGDVIFSNLLFKEPVGYLLEVESKEWSFKKAIEPFCDMETFQTTKPFRIFDYVSKSCPEGTTSDGTGCSISGGPVVFELNETTSAADLSIEHVVDSAKPADNLLPWFNGSP